MTRPRGRVSESTPGEDPLAGRHVRRSRRPASAREEAARVTEGEELGEPATDDLLDRRERRASAKRKAPGPTRTRDEDHGTTTEEAPAVPPTDPTDPTSPTDPDA